MENKEMDTQAVDMEKDLETSSYSIVAYPGAQLPDNYLNLIRSSWLRSLRFGNQYFKMINNSAYYSTYKAYIESLLKRPHSTVRLAVMPDDHDSCYGWSIVEDNGTVVALHYVYVQKDYRRSGIGMSLIPQNINTITHLTNDGSAIWASKCTNKPNAKDLSKPFVVFNPF